jgi:hypothetical protein
MRYLIGVTQRLLSSQRYLDDSIVAEKRESHDYTVTVVTTPIGRVVVDGHHSLAAAKADGVEPEIEECQWQDTLTGLNDLEQWLIDHWIDSDYYWVDNGQRVF